MIPNRGETRRISVNVEKSGYMHAIILLMKIFGFCLICTSFDYGDEVCNLCVCVYIRYMVNAGVWFGDKCPTPI
jgi:hypothetical protein